MKHRRRKIERVTGKSRLADHTSDLIPLCKNDDRSFLPGRHYDIDFESVLLREHLLPICQNRHNYKSRPRLPRRSAPCTVKKTRRMLATVQRLEHHIMM